MRNLTLKRAIASTLLHNVVLMSWYNMLSAHYTYFNFDCHFINYPTIHSTTFLDILLKNFVVILHYQYLHFHIYLLFNCDSMNIYG